MGCCSSKSISEKKYAAFKNDVTSPLLHELVAKLPSEAKVVILRLKGLNDLKAPPSNFSGSADPYVEMKLSVADPFAGEQHQRSTHKAAILNPKWVPAEKFQFIVSSKDTAKLLLSVYSFRPIKDPIPMADALLHLKDFNSATSIHKTIKLIDPTNGKAQGSIDLEIQVVSASQADNMDEHLIYEYQRWQPVVEWGSTKPGHFLPTDPGHWSTQDGHKFDITIDGVAPVIQPNWEIAKNWCTLATEQDPEGWQYAGDFSSKTWFEQSGNGLMVRRRLWKREVVGPEGLGRGGTAAAGDSSAKAGRRGRKVTEDSDI